MITRARLSQITIGYPRRVAVVSFVAESRPEEFEAWRGKEIDLEIEEHHEKRSLTANAYYRQLLAKVAWKLGVTNNFAHNRHIREYGQPETIDGKLVMVTLPDTDTAENKALELEKVHLKPTADVDADGNRLYILMRGSHSYNTVEMARLIDGLVSTAKELGIETLTPDELAKLRGYSKEAGA